MAEFCIETERLIVRQWRDEDLDALHALCTDPQVMATIGPLHDEDKTRAMLGRLQERQARDGCTFWAIERRENARVLGFCGVARGTVPFIQDKLEIGWRLASDCWGRGYAREAAEASIRWAGEAHPGEAIWAITSVGNSRSRGLMQRLGMRYMPNMDFDHPNIEPGSELLPHVTYCLGSTA
jgi:RimJ/RimL family protein N-acetyltransferase